MENLREIVLDTLLTLERDGGPSHRLIGSVLNKYDYLEAQEKRFLKRVTEGTLERQIELDYYLDHVSSVPVRKMKPLIRCLMRMSAYQLLYMDAIPDSAVCNEAVKLAQHRKFQNLKGFVNGVLRKLAREKDALPMPDRKENPVEWLCVKYSMPELITRSFLREYGEAMTEKILQGLLEIHPVSLRMPQTFSESDMEAVKNRLTDQGVQLEGSAYDPHIVLARDMEGAESLSDFTEGNLTVQDVSSVLAVKAAGIQAGDLVIDACAAPGGKSILASELTGETGKVVCGDVSEAKTEKIQENIDRMGRNNITVKVWDARTPLEEWKGTCDVLLLDVPCSGFGVIGKKRDIKYHVTPEGLTELEGLQKEIVRGAIEYLKPGGTLLYSTCTIRDQENRQMVQWMVENLPLEPMPILKSLPESALQGVLAEKEVFLGKKSDWEACCVQLLPGVLSMDGFFAAKLRRK
ncbi:MAG: 16S rRNA (cytosine(967)-C(5))-methyltransferase RsmB [Lachnospiraceae bacterium]|nr:16S rRNA (cytosine(967)-C(5))-methyltransferase RsmB [Lachnospiraceae bacterium]